MAENEGGGSDRASEVDAADITALLQSAHSGDRQSFDRLFGVVYQELRRIAQRQLRSAPSSVTLETTALVHEAYLRLRRNEQWSTRDRQHFYALAAQVMRRLVIDYARARTRSKRGGRIAPASIEGLELPVASRAESLMALDEALDRLGHAEPELARLVEWRVFGGMSNEEVADLLAVSERTVKRRWRLARAFLLQELAPEGTPGGPEGPPGGPEGPPG
jgi:RNA polymerase sigma factor (TIGR02999 family)